MPAHLLALVLALVLLPADSDATPGDLEWHEQLDVGGADDETRAMAPAGNWIIVAGDGAVAGVATWLLRAYDVKNGGALLWSDAQPNSDGATEARSVAAS